LPKSLGAFRKVVRVCSAAAVFSAFGATTTHAEHTLQACQDIVSGTNESKEELPAELKRYDECERDFINVIPIGQEAAAGENVVRALIWRGERALPLFIEYARAKDGRTWLDVRAITEVKPRQFWSIPNSEFDVVRNRWLEQDQRSAVGKAEQEAEKTKDRSSALETVCIGSLGATVETAEDGRTARVELDACNSWEYDFVYFLYAQALKDAGDCAQQEREGREDIRLIRCLARAPRRSDM
jgi:hypothetical protein